MHICDIDLHVYYWQTGEPQEQKPIEWEEMIMPHGSTIAAGQLNPSLPPSLCRALLAQQPTVRLSELYQDTDQYGK